MRKSIPVSEDLKSYFSDPCPVLSENNSKMILGEIQSGYDWIVEYGTGASTVYFMQGLLDKNCSMVSVENNFDWFSICIQEIKNIGGFEETGYEVRPWSMDALKAFIATPPHDTNIPEKFLRYKTWRDKVRLGPFFRFSPAAKSRFSGKLGIFWPPARGLFSALMALSYRVFPKLRPVNGEWRGKHDNFNLIIRNVSPSIKDQYGEAPNRQDYIDAGLKDIREELKAGKRVSAIFIIDGGPRHWIVNEILDLEEQEENFKPTIVLCDACRAFYWPVLERREAANFVAGTNRTLKGDPVEVGVSGEIAELWAGGDKKGDELSQRELWVYKQDKVANTG